MPFSGSFVLERGLQFRLTLVLDKTLAGLSFLTSVLLIALSTVFLLIQSAYRVHLECIAVYHGE